MSERELIETAAKAAGLELARWDDSRECMNHPFRSEVQDSHWWNPLNDDGDALRLAVRLRMSVCVEVDQTWVCVAGMPSRPLAFEGHAQDPCAATRRAIVMAAALLPPTREFEKDPGCKSTA